MSNTNKTKNHFKTAVRILSSLLAVVIVCNISYVTYLFLRQSNAEKKLNAAVDTAVSSCTELLNEFGMTDARQDYIDTYKENMENCDTALQKAYIANTMLTYAASSTNLENSNFISDIYQNGGAGQSKGYIVDELNSIRNQLQAAINEYTLFEEE